MAPKPPTLEHLLTQVNEVSTLPHMIIRVTEAAKNPKFGAGDLSRVIETDPALSARILKCVNSVAHGLSKKIESLQYAISYLGFQRVTNLAIGATVCRIFQGQHQIGPYNRFGLWRHLVSVAVTGRMIALRHRMDEFEQAFLAGLLHDLGLILFDQYAHDAFSHLMTHFPEDRTLVEAEREYFGFDHAELGFRVASEWNLPTVVTETIRRHHEQGNDYGAPHDGIRACVELANTLCTLQGIGAVGLKRIDMNPGVLKRLGLKPEDLRILAEDMTHELGLHQELIHLAAA